jgi:magnesium-transporting ATPase (P-type)
MSGEHINHATAVFCEITLAISIGVITKIIKSPPPDRIARETNKNRLKEGEFGWLLCIFYTILCWCSDLLPILKGMLPKVALVISLAVLLGFALCPTKNNALDYWFFWVSFTSFVLICLSVYHNRKTFTQEGPEIEVEG